MVFNLRLPKLYYYKNKENTEICEFKLTGKDSVAENLIWDVGLAVLTFGASKGLKFIKKIKFKESTRTFEATGKGAVTKLDDVSDVVCKGSSCTRPGACFVAGTMILVASIAIASILQTSLSSVGLSTSTPKPIPTSYNTTSKPIEQIKKGEWVVSRDQNALDNDKPNTFSQVKRTFQKEVNKLQYITTIEKGFDGVKIDGKVNSIVSTTNHPFYDKESKGWIEAESLEVGDKISNDNLTVLSNETKTLEKAELVYNFEVTGTHTYYLGEELDSGVWVHNACEGIRPRAASARNQVDLEHIREGHAFDAPARAVNQLQSKFNEGIDIYDEITKSFTKEAIIEGPSRNNTWVRDVDMGYIIGKDKNGLPTSILRTVQRVSDGFVVTSFPL